MASSAGTDSGHASHVKQQKPQQQQVQQSKAQQVQGQGQQAVTTSVKRTKGKKNVLPILIREANPVAITASRPTAAIEVVPSSSSAKLDEVDEWKTVNRKSSKKKTTDENVVQEKTHAVNGIQQQGKSKKQKKQQQQPQQQQNQGTKATLTESNKKQSTGTHPVNVAEKQKQQQQQPSQKKPNQTVTTAQASKKKPDKKPVITDSSEDGDPVKRLRNLKKRLQEIEQLKQRDKSSLVPDQVEKIKRYNDIKKQVAKLELEVLA